MNKTFKKDAGPIDRAFRYWVVSAVIAYALPPKGPKRDGLIVSRSVTKETVKLNDPKAQANPQQADYVITSIPKGTVNTMLQEQDESPRTRGKHKRAANKIALQAGRY